METLFDIPPTKPPNARKSRHQSKAAQGDDTPAKQPKKPSKKFSEKWTASKQKNRPLGSTKAFLLSWEDYIECGYVPMSAEWCLKQLAAMAVPFGLDEDGSFWFAQERTTITPGMRASIEFRRAEIYEILREERDMLASLKRKTNA